MSPPTSSTSLEVRRALGELPPMWHRRVIFVANLLGLFFGNDQETGVLRKEVGPLETYGGRLIPLLGLLFRGSSSNLAILEQAPDPDLVRYFRDELKLDLPDVEVLAHEDYQALMQKDPWSHAPLAKLLGRLETHEAEWLDGFVTDPCLMRLAQLLRRQTITPLEASRRGNNKLLLHQFLVLAGLPTFESHLAGTPGEVPACLAALRKQGYRSAAIKAQIGASGIGLVRVPTDHGGEIPPYLFYEGACLVQGWMDDSFENVDAVRSPSVQLFLDDTSLTLYDLTEQILSPESVHEGNLAEPPWLESEPEVRTELMRQAEMTGAWLHRQGYRGTASVDFHVARRGSCHEVRVCEINARVTGATYPSVLARHYSPKGHWLMRNLKLAIPVPGRDLLSTLREAGLLFHPGRTPSILPINFNTQSDRGVVKGQFLCLAETIDKLWQLLDSAQALLPLKGEFDRD